MSTLTPPFIEYSLTILFVHNSEDCFPTSFDNIYMVIMKIMIIITTRNHDAHCIWGGTVVEGAYCDSTELKGLKTLTPNERLKVKDLEGLGMLWNLLHRPKWRNGWNWLNDKRTGRGITINLTKHKKHATHWFSEEFLWLEQTRTREKHYRNTAN